MLALALMAGPAPVLAVSATAAGALPADVADADLLRAGLAALGADDGARAIAPLSELAARRTGRSTEQALLALAYQRSDRTNAEAAELAMAGYDLALRADPGNALAAGLGARLAFERGRYAQATELFGRAALADPGNDGALLGLAAAAYMAGDPALAGLAAGRAGAVAAAAPTRAAALRIAALAEAALGHPVQARAAWAALRAIAPDEAAATGARLTQIEATNPVDQPGAAPVAGDAGDSPDQVSVDVAIVLSQNTRRERIGLNLLDGLALNYSYSNLYSRTRAFSAGFDATVNGQRVITQAIGVPQLTYNLNLFNRGGQFYNVVARPSLTAYRGETSEFFIGRSLKVAVSGVNTAQLEQIDIGIEMRVTPIDITPEGTRVRIEATRSFLTADPAGNFNEALTTFRQRVAATAQVRFGETLILSGLSERVDDTTVSKTPVLGDMPVVQTLFRQKNQTRRQDAALILITPSRPGRVAGQPFLRGEGLARVAALWSQVIDPRSNAAAVAAQLGQVPSFTRMRAGDARLTWPQVDGAMPQVLAGLLAQGGLSVPDARP